MHTRVRALGIGLLLCSTSATAGGAVDLATAKDTLVTQCGSRQEDGIKPSLREGVCACTWDALALDRDHPVVADLWVRAHHYPDTAQGWEWTKAWWKCTEEMDASADVARLPVVIATRPLPPGHRLEARDLHKAMLPPHFIPPLTFTNPDVAIGRVLNAWVLQDENVRFERLAPPGTAPGVAAYTPEGHTVVRLRQGTLISEGIVAGDIGDLVRRGNSPCIELHQVPLVPPEAPGGPLGLILPDPDADRLDDMTGQTHVVWLRNTIDRNNLDAPQCEEAAP